MVNLRLKVLVASAFLFTLAFLGLKRPSYAFTSMTKHGDSGFCFNCGQITTTIIAGKITLVIPKGVSTKDLKQCNINTQLAGNQNRGFEANRPTSTAPPTAGGNKGATGVAANTRGGSQALVQHVGAASQNPVNVGKPGPAPSLGTVSRGGTTTTTPPPAGVASQGPKTAPQIVHTLQLHAPAAATTGIFRSPTGHTFIF